MIQRKVPHSPEAEPETLNPCFGGAMLDTQASGSKLLQVNISGPVSCDNVVEMSTAKTKELVPGRGRVGRHQDQSSA